MLSRMRVNKGIKRMDSEPLVSPTVVEVFEKKIGPSCKKIFQLRFVFV